MLAPQYFARCPPDPKKHDSYFTYFGGSSLIEGWPVPVFPRMRRARSIMNTVYTLENRLKIYKKAQAFYECIYSGKTSYIVHFTFSFFLFVF